MTSALPTSGSPVAQAPIGARRADVLQGRLFDGPPPPPGGERMDTLVESGGTRVIRIASAGDAAAADYLQAEDEWVALLSGEATLSVAGEALSLRAGDWVFLPAGVPHTVARTSQGAVWLAVHIEKRPPEDPPAPASR